MHIERTEIWKIKPSPILTLVFIRPTSKAVRRAPAEYLLRAANCWVGSSEMEGIAPGVGKGRIPLRASGLRSGRER